MAGYDDAKSNEWVLPAMYVSLAIAVIGGILSIANSDGGDILGDRYFKCLKCGDVVAMSIEEFVAKQKEENLALIDQLAQTNPEQAENMRKIMDGAFEMMEMRASLPSWGTFRWPFKCDSCGGKSISARKCSKCGEVFCPYNEQGDYNDKCPKCGHSAADERKAKMREGRKGRRKQ